MEKLLRKTEDNFFAYKHSKPPLELNTWKFSNHEIKIFSTPPLDKVHSFRVEKYII